MFRKKRNLPVLIMTTALFLLMQAAGAAAATIVMQVGQPWMLVDGVTEDLDPGHDTTPVVISDRTFVPIRAIVENFGGTVEWNGAEQKVSIKLHNTAVELWLGKTEAMVNGQAKILEMAPFASETLRTMVPLRFAVEGLGGQVSWDGASQHITLVYGDENSAHVVVIEGFTFAPASLSIPAGETVTWVNHDDVPHSIVGESFISPTLLRGQSFYFTFDKSGNYLYHCGFHPSMRGEIIVK